jgi:predicted nucleic acid-binding protein
VSLVVSDTGPIHWIRALPKRAAVQTPSKLDPSSQLGLGEREAIALAFDLRATQLLVDDRSRTTHSRSARAPYNRTTGVLEQAAITGLVDLPAVMQKLLNTNFRIDAEVVRRSPEKRRGAPEDLWNLGSGAN